MSSTDLHLTLCLTQDCNLRCRYCYGGEKAGRHMTLATARQALELALSREPEQLRMIYFGGEPLLRWRTMLELDDLARELASGAGAAVSSSVTTNGTLLTAERAEQLAERGFQVVLSCDGVEPAHDRNRVDRRGRGSHAATLAGLEAALAAGLRSRVVLVIDPSNLAWLAESADWLAGLGAHDLVANVNWAADWEAEGVEARLASAYQELAQRYVERFRRGRPFWISLIDDKIATHLRGGYSAGQRCDLGRRDLVVSPRGNLYPCDRLVGEDSPRAPMVIGHLEGGVDPERLARVIGAACQLPPECVECDLRDRCKNRCGCANLAMTGSIERPGGALCLHEQLAIACADAAAERLVAEENEAFLSRHFGGTGV